MTQLTSPREPHRASERRPRRHAAAGAASLAALALIACTSCSSSSPHRAAAASVATTPTQAPSPSPTVLPAGVLRSFALDLGAAPAGIGAGFGSIWVTGHRVSYLYRINPKTNKIVASISADNCCAPPFAAAGYVWDGNQLIDPRTNRIARTVPDGWLFAVVNGMPWALTATGIAGYDPQTLKETRRFTVHANVAKVSQPDIAATYGDGFFWVIQYGEDAGYGGAVAKVDPATGRTLHLYRTADVGDQPDIEFAANAVWLHGDGNNLLVKLDARTGVVRNYRLPSFQPLTALYPQTIAVGAGSLWIRVNSSKVVQIQPKTGKVVASYPADPDGNGGLPYVAFGSLWISNFDTDTVWRDRITSS